MKGVTKIQDNDGHWYWIPNDLLDGFKDHLSRMSGKYYLDCPDEFDRFDDRYDNFRTLGDPDNVPRFYQPIR